jgi:hypothetical protein
MIDLTTHLARTERLTCPTIQAAHAGTALRERLNDLSAQWDDARDRRDVIERERLRATAGISKRIKRMQDAIEGLNELIALAEIEQARIEAPYKSAFEATDDLCLEIEAQSHAERVKLRLIAAMENN